MPTKFALAGIALNCCLDVFKKSYFHFHWLLSEGNWVGKGRGDVTSTEDGWRLVLVERGEHHITAGQVPRELNWLHREQEMGGERKGICYFHRRLLETGVGGG